MKKLEFSEPVSHFLILSSVLLAFLPFVLGDHLTLIVNSLINEGSVMFDQLSASVVNLLR